MRQKDEALSRLRGVVERAKARMDADDWATALDLLTQATTLAGETGLNAAWALWAKSVALDVTGRQIDALDSIEAALQADPTAVHAHASREIILGRVHDLLADEAKPAQERARAFEALRARNVGSYADHLAQVSVLREIDGPAAALCFAKIISVLWPTDEVHSLIHQLGGEQQ